MKKKFICVFLALAVIMSIAAVSFAAEVEAAATTESSYSYFFGIDYPMTGSAVASVARAAEGGMSPWVKPSISTVKTVYWLKPSAASINTLATDLVYKTGTAKSYFTYKTGFGGATQTYQLVGGAAVASYEPYTARGTWSPD